jgi:hypothetical protein
MKQHEAVIKVMEENGGYATLGFLNQNVFKISECKWGTKTPFASIRRIVQDERFFFRIRPGLWALKSYKHKLPPEILPSKDQPKEKQEEYNHAYYQGLLVEVGNLKKHKTYIPGQDKNKLYVGRKLSEVATVTSIYNFSYESIVRAARTIDVIWFNERIMPSNFFEVEHSTDIKNSLSKFVELQDFNSTFYIVANEKRRREFEEKVRMAAFNPIGKRTKFWSYDTLAEYHSKTSELAIIESRLNL